MSVRSFSEGGNHVAWEKENFYSYANCELLDFHTNTVKAIIKWFIYLVVAAVIIRVITLLSGFNVYLTSDPWDWFTLALILSPAIPLVLFIFWGKSQKSMVGQVSPTKQVFMPWWMVGGDSPIARTLGRDRPIWQMVLWVVVVLFALCFVVILGMVLIPHVINFMAARM